MTRPDPPDRPSRGAGAAAEAGTGLARAWQVGFAVAVLVQLVVLYWPRGPSSAGVPGLDKVVHLAIFAVTAWAGLRAGVPARWIVGVLLAHAVVSEVVQHELLPDRTGDPLDALADAIGTLAAVAASGFARRPG